ncbi:MAG: hypothetical protein R6V86_00935 [Spirochaetia bacterium]
MERIPSITPREILLEEFLIPMNITALRFSKYFGNSADFWIGFQVDFDLRKERRTIATELEKIPRVKAS